PEGRAYGELVEWWAAQYAGAPRTPELPLERFRKAPQAEPSDGFIWWGLEPGLAARLDRLGRSVGVTYYGIRLAGFVALLAELNRQPDVVLGAYVTNRTRVESQSMFGFFANLAVLRMAFDPALTFRVWARVAQEAIAEVQARGEIPYEHLAEELRRRGVNPPALNAIFAVSDYAGPVRLGNVEMTLLDRRMEVMPWGFCLAFDRHQEATHCRVMFDAARYHPARVRRFIDQYIRLLDVVSARPDEPMAGLLGITGRGSWWSRLLRR
ncbi:MAG: condensation domain-containing protein, partial [Verrucomicrobia bacterium]|nr:condensation domain-containing protein [Verrucomicrobiota bacterium]